MKQYFCKKIYMKKIAIYFCAFLLINNSLHSKNMYVLNDTNENSTETILPDLNSFFTGANTFFEKYVSNGKVDYKAIQAEQTKLNALVDEIAKTNLSASDKNTKIAFYLNAYNILVIKSVINNMPLNKPTDVKGFFDANKFTVAGESLTLNDIENKKLRPDARVHFCLVCAAISCPKITTEAFMPDKVQAQMDSRTIKTLNDPGFIKVDDANKKASISQLFVWYKDDFEKSAGTVLNFINKYKAIPIPADYAIDNYTYDWSLNSK